jgi:uncharacterized protein
MEYYGSWNRDQLMILGGWLDGEVDVNELFVDLYADSRWLDRLLIQFPEADVDGDGRISADEAVRWHAARVPALAPGRKDLRWMPTTVSHWKELVTMADGAVLATEVYLPAGEGPFPVLVGRGVRLGGQMDGAHWYLALGYAAVSQDLVPEGEELVAGAHGARSKLVRDVASDTATLLDWVSEQAWCNGKTAIFGYSAGGMATLPVLESHPTNLTAAVTHITATDFTAVYRMRGGVMVSRNRLFDPEEAWEPGDTPSSDRVRLTPLTTEDQVGIFKTDFSGWFDIFLQGAIDDWVAWRESGRATLIIGGGTHGALPRPSLRPPDYADSDIFWPDAPAFDLIKGEIDEASIDSVLYYFLMGDFTDPAAPGNEWRVTRAWPLPHQDKNYFLTVNDGLSLEGPASSAEISYDYDPLHPNARADIEWRSLVADGPVDQRTMRDRSDVVYFTSDPLDEPLEITGRIWANLFLSTDVPDTTFLVKFLDIYPDGYEAMIAHGILMARYRNGFDHPSPVEADQACEYRIDLWSTAIVLGRNHRLGIYITNSEYGRFQVHPNCWEPISSYAEARTAHNRIHVSPEHPSHIVLPVVGPGASKTYDPAEHRLCRKAKDYRDKR